MRVSSLASNRRIAKLWLAARVTTPPDARTDFVTSRAVAPRGHGCRRRPPARRLTDDGKAS